MKDRSQHILLYPIISFLKLALFNIRININFYLISWYLYLFNDYKSKLGYESKNSNGPIYFFITILYFLNDKACMSYDHGSLNRRTGGLCVIGELYALLLSHNSL